MRRAGKLSNNRRTGYKRAYRPSTNKSALCPMSVVMRPPPDVNAAVWQREARRHGLNILLFGVPRARPDIRGQRWRGDVLPVDIN